VNGALASQVAFEQLVWMRAQGMELREMMAYAGLNARPDLTEEQVRAALAAAWLKLYAERKAT
jgi:hypothetical protein